MTDEIVEYNLVNKPKPKTRRKIKENNNTEAIDKKINELNDKINKLQELEKEKQDRIANKRKIREEKKIQKELDKENKLKLAEENKKQDEINRDKRIRELIEESSKNIIKTKIDKIDSTKDDILKFHVNKHNNLRRLNLNF
jgi:hypothetical protein